jgi:uncharacterized protein
MTAWRTLGEFAIHAELPKRLSRKNIQAESLSMIRRAWIIVALTVSVLLIVTYIHQILWHIAAYERLDRRQPFYVAESIDKISGVAICVLVVCLVCRTNLQGISRELGLSAPIISAIVFGLVVSSPMLVGFAFTRALTPNIDFLPLLFLTVFSPIVEEIEFRGLGVRFLHRSTGWPFRVAVWPSVVLAGLAHVEKGQSLLQMSGLLLLTGGGALVFAWLVYRWQNLWVPISLHICMNLWWELFSVAKTAIGGWLPFALQTFTMLLAIILTLYWTRSKEVELH